MVTLAVMGICVKDGRVMDYAKSKLAGYDLNVHYVDSVALDEDLDRLADFIRLVPTLDFMIIHVHGDVSFFRHFDEVRKALEANRVSAILQCTEAETTLQYRYLFRQGDDDYDRILKYQEINGDDNMYATAVWALNTFGGLHLEIPERIEARKRERMKTGKTDPEVKGK